MADRERMTVTLPSDVAFIVQDALDAGDYASCGEVLREALQDWRAKRAAQAEALAAHEAELDRGLADVAAGRVREYDTARIAERGRTLFAGRSRSA